MKLFEDCIKHEIETFRMAPKDRVWEHIAAALEKDRRRGRWRWFLAGISLYKVNRAD